MFFSQFFYSYVYWFIPDFRQTRTITQSSLRYLHLNSIPTWVSKHDGFAQALGLESMDDYYSKVAYWPDADSDSHTDTDDNTNTDKNTDINSTAILNTKTRHQGFPNLKYLYLGRDLGGSKLRYFSHKAKWKDQLSSSELTYLICAKSMHL